MRIIVTAGNSGVGRATAGALAADGHHVVIASAGSRRLQWAGRVLSPHLGQTPADGAPPTIEAITTPLPNGARVDCGNGPRS